MRPRRTPTIAERTTTFVIAEAGVNHNGSVDLALALVDAAAAAGADAVKFQTFDAGRLVAASAKKAAYQFAGAPGDEHQYAMLKALELPPDGFRAISRHCEDRGIEFLSSPFDERSADLLGALGVRRIKVPSGEITNLPFLRHIAGMGLEVLLSTGMSWLGEVETAVRVLEEAGGPQITLLHCVTEYPAPVEQTNLRALHTLRESFGLPVGYSDHTPGTDVAIAAVALGARVVEKHLTLDRDMPGPDHAASLDPTTFATMVGSIRNVERALGTGRKQPAPCELANLAVARKSVVTARPLQEGQQIVEEDLVIKRPGSGIPPAEVSRLIGRRAARAIDADEVVQWSDVR